MNYMINSENIERLSRIWSDMYSITEHHIDEFNALTEQALAILDTMKENNPLVRASIDKIESAILRVNISFDQRKALVIQAIRITTS